MALKISPPELEARLGLEAYKTPEAGIGGRIKESCDDFAVEEVGVDGRVVSVDAPALELDSLSSPGKYLHFTLRKTNWETHRLVKELARRCGVSQKRFSFAGTKDKRAVTAQRVSASGVSAEKLASVGLKDVVVSGFSYADDPVSLGNLWGNRFTIVVGDVEPADDLIERLDAISRGLAGGVPNFFGPQRFGVTRPVTHLVGKALVQGETKRAVDTYLANTFGGEEDVERAAREELAATQDYKKALQSFPKRLGYEKALLNHLVKKPDDHAGAIRQLPFNLQIMFVHAYQAWIYNRALSEAIRNEWTVEELPLVGFKTAPDDVSAAILEEEGVAVRDFRLRELPRLSSKGTVRECFTPLVDFEVVAIDADERHADRKKVVLRFRLEKGSYATVVLREFMKNEWWRTDT